MGALLSKIRPGEFHMRHNPKLFAKLVSLARNIKMSKHDLKSLFKMYAKIDVDLSGKISMLEFLNYFSLDQTEFNRRTFLLMDEDKNGKIDFVEFVAAIFNYCTFTWQGLCKYAFDLFDEDHSGFLDTQEVIDLVKFVYGKPLDDRVIKILDSIDEDMSGTITFNEFCKKNRSFPSLLFPAFHMQEVLRTKCMGGTFWNKYTEGRQKEDIDIMDVLMEMEADAEKAERQRNMKEAARKNAEYVEEVTENRLTPKVRIDANGKVVREGAARTDERARIQKMHEQETAKRKAWEGKQAAKLKRGGAEEGVAQLVDMSEEAAEEDPNAIPALIRAPKRKKGEKPNIHAGTATYSRLINNKRTPPPGSVPPPKKRNGAPAKATVIQVKAASNVRKPAAMQ